MTNEISESPGLKKRRKLFLVLPLLILPFVTLAFWALGGGRQGVNPALKSLAGINSEVPAANVSFRPQDKMSLYAEQDRREAATAQAVDIFNYPISGDSTQSGKSRLGSEGTDPGSAKVEQKLAELQEVLDASRQPRPGGQPFVSEIDPSSYGLQPGEITAEETSGQLDRLNRINAQIAHLSDAGSADDGGQDKDMQQINTMLDKILAIQHPENAAASTRKSAGRQNGSAYALKLPDENLSVPVLPPLILSEKAQLWESRLSDSPVRVNPDSSQTAGSMRTQPKRQVCGAFYDIDAGDGGEKKGGRIYTFQAEIAGSQTLVSGAAVKMHLTADVVVNGILIPKGNFVFGTATVNGERLEVTVSHIRFHSQILPVDLKVFDLDGMAGIRIPGAIGREASKNGADRALQSVRLMSLDPGMAAQAAAAGIEAAKGMLGKKVKLVRVTVKAGYPVLLLDSEGLRKADR